MGINIKIFSADETDAFVKDFPNLTYSNEFSCFKEKRYGFKTGFLAIYKGDNFFGLIPINYNDKELHSVFKDYTEPYFATADHAIDWREVAQAAKK